MNVLFRWFLLFVTAFYFPGIIFSYLFRENFLEYYNILEYNYWMFFCFYMVFFVVLYLIFSLVYYLPQIRIARLGHKKTLLLEYALSFSYCALAVYFFVNYDHAFRHTNRISESSPFVTLLWAIKPLVSFVIVACVIRVVNDGELKNEYRMSLYFILLGTILSLTSSMQVINILLIISLLLFPQIYRVNGGLNFSRAITLITFVPVGLSLALMVGLSSKYGKDVVFSSEIFNVLGAAFNSVVTRVSSSFVSVLTILNELNLGVYKFDLFESIYQTLSKRFGLISGVGGGDEIQVVNRYNQLSVFSSNPERAGASPGLLASTLYIPIFPLGVIVICFYVSYVLRILSTHIKDISKFGAVPSMAIFVSLLYFFESPLNFFYFVDPFFVAFLSFVFYFRFCRIS